MKNKMLIVLSAMIVAACGDSGGSSSGGGGGNNTPICGGCQAQSIAVVAPVGPLTVQADTMLLLHFDGNTTDAAGRHAVSTDTTTSDVSTSAFGVASRAFNGSTYLDFLNSADFDMGANDFELQWWMRTTQAAAAYVFGAHPDCTGNGNTISADVNVAVAGQLRFMVNSGGTNYAAVTAHAVTDGVWHHVKVAKVSGTLKLYLDEVLEHTLPGLSPVPAPTGNFTIGRPGQCATMYYLGDIDEFRVNKN